MELLSNSEITASINSTATSVARAPIITIDKQGLQSVPLTLKVPQVWQE